ncbi:MAG: type II toxin-antitoxin system VapC family toxin [Thermoanaerobaculia bacterium]|nr:type II toxin-antitoxin system VapC family toxin [Thermoanaerobaculia bacterium]
MSFLADTHVYLWWLNDDPRLGPKTRAVLTDPAELVYVSAAVVWEIAIKVQLGKLDFKGDPVAEIEANGFFELPITARHAKPAGSLPRHHDDPFDRMLIAQAESEGLVLMSFDGVFASYGTALLSG